MKTKLLYLLPAAVLWIAARPFDVLSELHVTLDDVRNYTFHMLTTEDSDIELPAQVRKIGKQMAAGPRTVAVRAMGTLVKAYVHSKEFRERFDRQVRDQYHVSDEQTAETQLVEQMQASDLRAAADQQAQQATAAFAQMPAGTLAMMAQQQIQTMQQQLAVASSGCDKAMIGRDVAVLRQLQGLSKSNPAEFKTQYIDFMNRYLARASKPGLERQTERLAEAKTKVADYQQRLAQYKANADPNAVIKKRLWEFIALAERVDFTAKTVSTGYRVEFVRPDYRAQSNEWKLLYRIGQEPVMAARDIARAWLTELQ
jgi:hypothetical protein